MLEKCIEKLRQHYEQVRYPDGEEAMLKVPKFAEKAKKEKLVNPCDIVWVSLTVEEKEGTSGKDAKGKSESRIKERNNIKNLFKKQPK